MRVSVSLRRAAAFPVISLLIQFAGQTLCLVGHWRRHQPVIIVVAAFLYVLAGTRSNNGRPPIKRQQLNPIALTTQIELLLTLFHMSYIRCVK